MKLAVFDLDHTLMPMDTGDVWVRWLAARACAEQRREIFETLDRFARQYRAQTLDICEFEEFQMKFLASFSRRDLEEERSRYVEALVRPHVPDRALALVRSHKEAGDLTALCTATYSFAAQGAADLFGVDRVLATRPQENDAGEFTGKWLEPITYSEGKVAALKILIAEFEDKGETVESIAFYSDSCADLPLFEFAQQRTGSCTAVNPDAKLAQIARERGWRMIETYSEKFLRQTESDIAQIIAARENAPQNGEMLSV